MPPCNARGLHLRLALVGGLGLALFVGAAAQDSNAPKKITIAAAEDLFRDIPKQTVESAAEPFRTLMERETGYTGDVVTVAGHSEVGRRLAKDRAQLGVVEGFQFAWLKPKYPDLRPLVIAVNQQTHLHAYVMTSKAARVEKFEDLKGKMLGLPTGTKGYARLFLDRLCAKSKRSPKEFFSKIDKPANMEDALDDVVDGQTDAVVVDGVALDRFRQRKPGRFSQLKEVARSPTFPATVIVYRTGRFEEATLKRFRDALRTAADHADGRQMLTLWKLTGFEAVPEDYGRTLEEIRKVYPPPEEKTK
jgi:ABC-type phosphate/phosphonate transport system substrate-binding protein